MILKTSTHPRGPSSHLNDGDIVQRLMPNGRFKDTYACELIDGDEYWVPSYIQSKRNAETILDFMEEENLELQYGMDIDGDEFIELYGFNKREPLVKYPRGKGCLRQALEFAMDMGEHSGE